MIITIAIRLDDNDMGYPRASIIIMMIWWTCTSAHATYIKVHMYILLYITKKYVSFMR